MYLWVNKETASFNVHTVGWSLNVKNNYLSKVISNNLSKVAKFFFLIKYPCDQNFYQDILAISNFSSLLALYIKTGWLKRSQFSFLCLSSENLKKMLYSFTYILSDYLVHEITKEFWKNSHFVSMRDGFLLRMQNSLR